MTSHQHGNGRSSAEDAPAQKADAAPALFSVIERLGHNTASVMPTDLVRGPWDHGFQHGGAVSAILAWGCREALKPNASRAMQLARLTTEIFRPVPAVEPLVVSASAAYQGRRLAVVRSELASVASPERILGQATSQWVAPVTQAATAQTASATDLASIAPPRPIVRHDPGQGAMDYPRPGFNCDVFDLRAVKGSTEQPGPGIFWAKMLVPVVAQEQLDLPALALPAVADLVNAVGWEPSPKGEPMINPDVSLHVMRYPVSPWVCIDAKASIASNGLGLMEATLLDERGTLGRVTCTLIENTGATIAGLVVGDV